MVQTPQSLWRSAWVRSVPASALNMPFHPCQRGCPDGRQFGCGLDRAAARERFMRKRLVAVGMRLLASGFGNQLADAPEARRSGWVVERMVGHDTPPVRKTRH